MSWEEVDRQMPDYQALSTDAWPTKAGAGAKLHIVDTGQVMVMYEDAWEEDLRLMYAIANAEP